MTTERLVSCAIIRDGELHHGYHTHWELRANMGDDNPAQGQLGDSEGFMSSHGRFLKRSEAVDVGYKAGQCASNVERLLSSSVLW